MSAAEVATAVPPVVVTAPKPVASGAADAQDKKDALATLKTKLTIELIEQLYCKKPEDDGTEFGLPHVARYKTGGLHFTDPKDLAAQKGVIKDLITSFGSNLLQGKSLVNITMPVRIFEPRSFLQRIPDAWLFAPIYLNRASLTADPVERFKLCITFFIAGLHRCITQRKPFNPILGETFQARFTDGTQIFLEQQSHHPPISCFQVLGPDNLYTLSGYHEFSASFRATGIVGGQAGPNNIDFPDGTRVTFQMPTVICGGIVMGDRVVTWSGTVPFEDKKNGLKAEVVFNPDKPEGLFSMFSTPKTPADTIRGQITRTQDNKVISTITGSWVEGISFDNKPYWTKKQYQAFQVIPVRADMCLPSDCQFREDLVALKNGDLIASQNLKTKLEELQRYDQKLRKAKGSKH